MKTVFFIAFFSSISNIFFSQIIDKSMLINVAQGKINQFDANVNVNSIDNIYNESGELILYYANLLPQGYILIQTDYALEPVLAYSFLNNLDEQFLNLFKTDAQERINHLQEYKSLKSNPNPEIWNQLINSNKTKVYEQWPPEGTTSTGGWLESNWHQSAPYNNMCPFDNVSNTRSLAGCPAVAAAMIVDFNKKLNGTTFSDDDDYYHAYGGNNYFIDDDYINYKFPSFDSLNVILDSIQKFYDDEKELTNYEKAALVFACGTAAHQVYNSQGSGTFSVSQAYELYQKFSFENALLYTTLSDEMYDTLIYNMKNALPSHLAVVDAAWQYGHNVVVDGYNTDHFFHINFGWGGSSNGWWNIPDDGFPYSMNVLEGIIVNINFEEPVNLVPEINKNMLLFPNPGNGFINIDIPNEQQIIKAEVYNIEGKLIYSLKDFTGALQIPEKKNGMYFIKFYIGNNVFTEKYVLRSE